MDLFKKDERIQDLERRLTACDAKHDGHHEYRRVTDSKIDGMHQTLKEICDILREFKDAVPTIKRTKDNYTTIDTLLRWGAGVVILAGVVSFLKGVI